MRAAVVRLLEKSGMAQPARSVANIPGIAILSGH